MNKKAWRCECLPAVASNHPWSYPGVCWDKLHPPRPWTHLSYFIFTPFTKMWFRSFCFVCLFFVFFFVIIRVSKVHSGSTCISVWWNYKNNLPDWSLKLLLRSKCVEFLQSDWFDGFWAECAPIKSKPVFF